jgi:UDPglucose--hexose-1-phosphate uridylyltransferase
MREVDAVSRFVDDAVTRGVVRPEDRTWAYNTVLAQVGNASLAHERLADEDFAANVMGLVMPRPSEVADRFWELHAESPDAATDYFYRLCCDAHYVRTAAIARNLRWGAPTRWGMLQISINRSKPEKDPRDIARLAQAPPKVSTEGDPTCRLCMSNEGFWGRPADGAAEAYPPRGNLRIVPIVLNGERWGVQYSPYAYYNEHCIAMNGDHVPMHVDRACFEAMFDFVDQLPHYFIGSNADLPIVGGSILAHDHFQGGRHRFPLDDAPCDHGIDLPAFPHVQAFVLKWPTTVLSLRGADRNELVDCACGILDAWRSYDDSAVGIISHTGDVPHNTITPILRKDGAAYTFNLALRCNITTPAHPLGAFHPHEELHHIKKENIGLIEVMGLAILPPRLERELAAVADVLVAHAAAGGSGIALEEELAGSPLTAAHTAWACDVARRHPQLSDETVETTLRQEVGEAFAQVLETTGVFKWDEPGRGALDRFLDSL